MEEIRTVNLEAIQRDREKAAMHLYVQVIAKLQEFGAGNQGLNPLFYLKNDYISPDALYSFIKDKL